MPEKQPKEELKAKREEEKLLKEAAKLDEMKRQKKAEYIESVTEHIAIGTTLAEKYDAFNIRTMIIGGSGLVVTIGGIVASILCSIDYLPSIISTIVTAVGVAAFAYAAWNFYSMFKSDWGMMGAEGQRHRFETPLAPGTVMAIDPETKDILGTVKLVEKVHIIPQVDTILIKSIVDDPDVFFNKDLKVTRSVQEPLFNYEYRINAPVEINVIRTTRPKPQDIEAVAEDSNDDDDYEDSVDDDDYEEAMRS